jgi:hypothetical protein
MRARFDPDWEPNSHHACVTFKMWRSPSWGRISAPKFQRSVAAVVRSRKSCDANDYDSILDDRNAPDVQGRRQISKRHCLARYRRLVAPE